MTVSVIFSVYKILGTQVSYIYNFVTVPSQVDGQTLVLIGVLFLGLCENPPKRTGSEEEEDNSILYFCHSSIRPLSVPVQNF